MTSPSPRIVLFGATGYTGALTAHVMAKQGLRPVLAARSASRLDALAGEVERLSGPVGGVETADVSDPASVAALVHRDDVLVSTVGPFARLGEAAVRAAIDGRATAYLDSTGEPPFIRAVYESFGPEAKAARVALVTAFGYDYVPGNLAGALAVRDAVEAGTPPTRVDVGYFVRGKAGFSGGTLASAAGILMQPSYAWTHGTLVTERPGRRTRTFEVRGSGYDALSVGGTEHFSLPRATPSLTDVRVYLGWAGSRTRLAAAGSGVLDLAAKVPGVRAGGDALLGRVLRGSTGGPDAAERAAARTLAVAEAFDGVGRLLSRAVVDGPSPYDLTAELLAWGAGVARDDGWAGFGAVGPVDGLGVEALERGCERLGLVRVD